MTTIKKGKKNKVQIIGMGLCGVNIVDKLLYKNHKYRNNCIAIDTNREILKKYKNIKKKLLIGKGEGCLNSYDYAFSLAIKYQEKIEKAIKAKTLVIIGSSGATGWASSRYIINKYANNHKIYFIIQIAFKFEGKKRRNKVKELITFINRLPNIIVIKIDPNKIMKDIKWKKLSDILFHVDLKIVEVIHKIMK